MKKLKVIARLLNDGGYGGTRKPEDYPVEVVATQIEGQDVIEVSGHQLRKAGIAYKGISDPLNFCLTSHRSSKDGQPEAEIIHVLKVEEF